MNLPQPPSPQGGLHRIVRMLSLLLLQHALAPSTIDGHMRSLLPSKQGENPVGDGESLPYLKVVGSEPLRFSALPPPPDLTGKPPGSAPPFPPPTPAAVATPASAPAPAAPANNPEKKVDDSPVSQAPAAPNNPPPSILPDDIHPATRPEDFLPYFQFPSADSTNLGSASVPRPPSPGQLPPSSATYQQK